MNTSRTVLFPGQPEAIRTPAAQRSVIISMDQYSQFINIPNGTRNAIAGLTRNGEIAVSEERIRTRPSVMNSDSNRQSNPSPDEIVIKGRGRRSLPVKWSPIPIESPQKTPLSSLINKSPKRGLIALRSSPRKRLQLNDALSNELTQGRKYLLNTSPLARRTNDAELGSNSTPDASVNGLSKPQLVHILKSIIEKHPQIKDEIGTILDSGTSSSSCSSEEANLHTTQNRDVSKEG